MKGKIIINAEDNSNYNQSIALKNEFLKLGVDVDIIRNRFALASFSKEDINFDFEADFIVFLDKDILLAKFLEFRGFKLFNSASCIEICDDKFLTSICLKKNDIPIPNTYLLPLEYNAGTSIPEFSFPYILKETCSSLGMGVHLINNEKDFLIAKSKIGLKRAIIQEYIRASSGRDVRVIVLGGKVLCAMERINITSFLSNIAQGGEARPFSLRDDLEELAIKSARAVGADFCGIDFLFNDEDKPLVCEVNSNALFAKISSVSKVNIAEKYAKYIVDAFCNKSTTNIVDISKL